jgi:hypothetical protein
LHVDALDAADVASWLLLLKLKAKLLLLHSTEARS